MTTNSSSTSSSSITCDNIHHCRTAPSIVYSCVSTVFLCTWVALHRDVPDYPYEVWWKRLRDRIGMTVVALLAPELIVSIAFEEWTESSSLLETIIMRYPDCTWTETHTHLLQMSGFLLHDDGLSRRLAWPDLGTIEKLKSIRKGDVDILKMPVDEIDDKSKGDAIAKAIVVVQTLWFVLQAVHRVSQGLIVTELEVTTLGHTLLNILTYWCWWNKPRDIRIPIDVYLRRSTVDHSEPQTNHESESQQEDDRERQTLTGGSSTPRLPLRTRLGLYLSRTSTTCRTACDPTLFNGMFFGALFGAVHCLAWHSSFPSHIDAVLWRTSALIVTITPTFMSLLLSLDDIGEAVGDRFAWLFMFVYSCARICLLVIALLALRDLPYKAYVTPSWTAYLPHIG